uniref:Uncharacterized protein n=1 Tax=Dromaius novaehollandiae TaxID=8790 RepID=A0A8C4JUD4_DRONO
VLPVQPISRPIRRSPLPAVAAGPTWPRVFQNEVLVVKLLPVDGFASGAVVVGEVSSLTHELGDDAVEAAPLEAEALLVGAEAAEILCSEQGREVRAVSLDYAFQDSIWHADGSRDHTMLSIAAAASCGKRERS